MRIGIDISQLAFPGTGVARYIEHLIESLLEIDSTNTYVLFYSSLRKPLVKLPILSKPNVIVRRFRFAPTVLDFMWNIVHRMRIERLIGQVDIFHSSDWVAPPTHAKKVSTVHDLITLKFPESSKRRLNFNFRKMRLSANIVATQKRRFKWVARECDLIIADSHSTKLDTVRLLRVPEERVRVIYLGVDATFSLKTQTEVELVKKKYHIIGDYILAVGTREPRKNLARLVEAYSKMDLLEKQIGLVIAGNFGWGKDIKPVPGVRLLGFVPEADLPVLYAGAKLFAYPSLYEGFGLPILESLSSGTPVVTSNRGSMVEIAGPSTLVDPESVDSIKDGLAKVLLLKPKERKALIKEGIDWAKRFTWKETAKKTLKVYEELA